jgi:hypothetical protein
MTETQRLFLIANASLGECGPLSNAGQSPFTLAVFIAAVFLLAGGIKGMLGLGLPTVAMGLLSVAMTPAEAARILVIPALVPNIWQVALGPAPLTLGLCKTRRSRARRSGLRW